MQKKKNEICSNTWEETFIHIVDKFTSYLTENLVLLYYNIQSLQFKEINRAQRRKQTKHIFGQNSELRVSEQVKHAVDTEINRLGNPYNMNQHDALLTFNLFQ